MGWLDGQVALVTGGGSGIGRGIVERFLQEGAQVAALDRSGERVSQLTQDFDGRVLGIEGDVTQLSDNKRAVAETVRTFGRLDVFIGNAGVFDRLQRLEDIPDSVLSTAFDEMFGVNVTEQDNRFFVPAGVYKGQCFEIEPDASAASYFWAAAAITGGEVTVVGLDRTSLQGDVRFCDLLVQMGCRLEEHGNRMKIYGADCLKGIDCDMNGISDTVQTLAAVALFAAGPTTIRGVVWTHRQ